MTASYLPSQYTVGTASQGVRVTLTLATYTFCTAASAYTNTMLSMFMFIQHFHKPLFGTIFHCIVNSLLI